MSADDRLRRLPSRPLPGGRLVFTAAHSAARRRGLAGLAGLPPEWALHLRPCRSVHTFGMRFAIDLVWLDREGRVLAVTPGVPPRRVSSHLRARSVIETAAGEGAGLAMALRSAKMVADLGL